LIKAKGQLFQKSIENYESLGKLANFLLYGEPITTYELDDKGNFKIDKELTEIGNIIFTPIQQERNKAKNESLQRELKINKQDNTRVVKKS